MADFENSPDLAKLMTIDPTGLSNNDAMTLAALLVDLSTEAASAGGLDRESSTRNGAISASIPSASSWKPG